MRLACATYVAYFLTRPLILALQSDTCKWLPMPGTSTLKSI